MNQTILLIVMIYLWANVLITIAILAKDEMSGRNLPGKYYGMIVLFGLPLMFWSYIKCRGKTEVEDGK